MSDFPKEKHATLQFSVLLNIQFLELNILSHATLSHVGDIKNIHYYLAVFSLVTPLSHKYLKLSVFESFFS